MIKSSNIFSIFLRLEVAIAVGNIAGNDRCRCSARSRCEFASFLRGEHEAGIEIVIGPKTHPATFSRGGSADVCVTTALGENLSFVDRHHGASQDRIVVVIGSDCLSVDEP